LRHCRLVGVRLIGRPHEREPASCTAAAPHEGGVRRDLAEPGREAFGPAELVELEAGADISLLYCVLGFGVVAEYSARDPEQAPVVAAHDQFEQRVLAGL